jgi:Tfp pilus assembly protein PilX
MDTKVLADKITKGIALQEKITALEAQASVLRDKAESNKRDQERLLAAMKSTEKAETELVHLEAEIARTQSALATYLKTLEEEGINLPIGQRQVVKGKL